MVAKHIYFVRHGESDANINRTVQGPDDPLSERGERQALRIAERATGLPFDTLVSSDYARTRKTAEYIAEACNKEIIFSELFREHRRPSRYVGTPHMSEENQIHLTQMYQNAADPAWRFEDAENYSDLVTRMDQAARFLESQESDNILVVTHGNFLRLFCGYVLTERQLRPEQANLFERTLRVPHNTGISIFTFVDDMWRMLTWNDYAHFAE